MPQLPDGTHMSQLTGGPMDGDHVRHGGTCRLFFSTADPDAFHVYVWCGGCGDMHHRGLADASTVVAQSDDWTGPSLLDLSAAPEYKPPPPRRRW